MGSAKVAVSGATKTTSHRCLDAAHGKTVNPIVARERPRQIGLSPETARTDLIAGKCGRGPTTPGHADAFQGSRITHSEARSRHKEQSLKRLRRKVRNNGFTTKSMRSPRPEFRAQPAGRSLRASAARCCGPHGSKNPTTATTKSSARAGCGEGRACRREPAPGARQILHFVQNDKKTRSDERHKATELQTSDRHSETGQQAAAANKKAPPKKESRGKKQAKNHNKPQASKNHKKESKNIRQSTPRTPPESKKSATKKESRRMATL